ncbi:acyl-CoA dehydrogenase family protein [Pseudomonas sp. MMS21-TM103]|uniref:acyl-CoA dehydrogenase family protein n=1 Tax=Pseudomonas sp. MMS21 TM103 TaxID=2886506 RepID=UPI001EDDCA57|nr:acyl-CoA dehydrogenase family protein [Pseudomonas sp. MMS21 TM103]MCG4455309.1 acyl-CoA dehydrogenase family protein [Pseudomonas sp. MMS21 TM103]
MQRTIFETEHSLFRDAFSAFLKKEVLPHQDDWEAAGVVSREVWQKAGEMGFLLPWADEQYGGSGLKDFRYEQIMCEELAKINEAGFMLPLHSALCGPYIAEYGNAEQKARLLPGIIRGELILAVAMTEPSAGSDLAGMRTTAVDKGDHYVLNGSKVFISNGLLADVVIVAAKTDPANKHAMGLFLVERGMSGFERGSKLKKLGMHSQDTVELFFNEVKVPKENLLGDASGGFYYLMNMLAQERLTNACGAVAGAEAALQVTIDYVRERKAFDRPISHFQNTRFKLAEMRTQIDVAQVFVDRCVMDHNQKKLTPEVAAEAKLFTTELLGRVVDEGVQLHGGWGYMWEYPICKMYANARIQRIFAGTSEIMKEIISRGMKL